MIGSNYGVYISFALYLVFMLSIGWIFYKKTENLSDYILGSRGLGAWVTSMSAQASDMSGWLLLGLPGYAYVAGLESFWIAAGLALGTYLNWKFIAKRLRIYTEKAGNAITLPDYFENRFRDNSKILRITSAIFILIFFLIYTASGFVAGAKLFSTVFGISYGSALLIGVLVIISYTFLGGFMAVSWTDFFQGIIMFFSVTLVPVTVIVILGGFGSTYQSVVDVNPELLNIFTQTNGKALGILSICSLAAWGLGYFGQPHILARFMAIKNPVDIKKARIIAMNWVVISLGASVLIGLVGMIYFKTPEGAKIIADMNPAFEPERVFMVLVNAIAHPAVAGILLSAILAAIMSTADSQLLVASSALTEDLYRVLLKKDIGSKELVWVSRLSVVAIAFVAYFIAIDPDSSVLGLVAYAWAGFGATFGPLIILSTCWKMMTRRGAIAGILVGGITVIAWKQLSGGIFDLYEIVPGFVLSVIAIVIVSKLDHQPRPEVLEEYDKVVCELD